MKIVAHLGILDERELIGRALDHLQAIGVDQTIVCDVGSTDGTLEFLRDRSDPKLKLVQLSRDASWDVWHRAALDAIGGVEADWVLFLDADEFWLPRGGSLKSCRSLLQTDILSVNRYNVVVGPGGALLPERLSPQSYDQVFMYCGMTTPFWKMLEEDPQALWIRAVPAPKVIARRAMISEILMGTHDVIPPEGMQVRKITADDLVIAHVPLSLPSRFERRANNVEEFFSRSEAYFEGKQGWHWRHWRELRRQGRITQEFHRQVADEELIRTLRVEGVIRTAAELLNEPAILSSDQLFGPP